MHYGEAGFRTPVLRVCTEGLIVAVVVLLWNITRTGILG